jgi:predicted metal-dependent hydrolase
MTDRLAPLCLNSEEARLLAKGIAEFNSGRFFECHDTLEELWLGTQGPARAFFQGLIQIAVGFYHINQRNLRGGENQLDKGLQKLAAYGDFYGGVELAPLRSEVQSWLDRIRCEEALEGPAANRPRWRFTPQ